MSSEFYENENFECLANIKHKNFRIFGIPLFMDNDNHEVLVDYLLEQSSLRVFESSVDHMNISDNDMRTFIATISGRKVDFTPEADRLLQRYFVASRVERPGKKFSLKK